MQVYCGGVCIISDLRIADRFLPRAIGLLGQRPWPVGRALLITQCRQVHTFGMAFPLDILFIEPSGGIVRAIRNLQPWRVAAAPRPAHAVLEARAGWLPEACFRPGARLDLCAD